MGINIYLYPYNLNSYNTHDNCDTPFKNDQIQSFYSSYKNWNHLRIHLLYATIEYIKCCSQDIQFESFRFEQFLNDFIHLRILNAHGNSDITPFRFETEKLNVSIHLLKKYLSLLENLDIIGIYDFLNISGASQIIPYENSQIIINAINKIADFMTDIDFKKNITKIKELFTISYDNKVNIQID